MLETKNLAYIPALISMGDGGLAVDVHKRERPAGVIGRSLRISEVAVNRLATLRSWRS